MEEAGFVDVRQDLQETPWSPWPPEGTKDHAVGRIFQRFYETGVHGWLLQPLINYHNVGRFPEHSDRTPPNKVLQMTHEQVDHLTNAAIIELRQNDQHWFSSM